MNVLRFAALMMAIDGALVERSAPGAAPSAFRLFSAGENKSDEGSVFFTKASADALMAEQDERSRVYSSDFDHLSLRPDRPATSGRASGWHKLAVRPDADGNPELWAEDIKWCADSKAGLEADPPHWRFFSPAFKSDKESGEVLSYVNFALCINPLTHGLPSLASETSKKGSPMLTKEQCAAMLAKLGDIGAGEDERKQAMAALSEFVDGLPDEAKPAEGEKEGEKKAAAEGETEEKKAEGEKPADGEKEEKVEARAVMAIATDLTSANARIAKLEIDGLLRERADLPESIRTWLSTQTTATVRGYLKSSPAKAAERKEAPVQGERKAAGLQGAELEQLNRAMGIRPKIEKRSEINESGELVIRHIGPMRAREIDVATRAARAGGDK